MVTLESPCTPGELRYVATPGHAGAELPGGEVEAEVPAAGPAWTTQACSAPYPPYAIWRTRFPPNLAGLVELVTHVPTPTQDDRAPASAPSQSLSPRFFPALQHALSSTTNLSLVPHSSNPAPQRSAQTP